MRILVVGSGGREHALVWKLSQSPDVTQIFCAPGNGGIGQLAECVNISATDIVSLTDFAQSKSIDLTVVGPEAVLTEGIVDAFEKRGLRVFGPNKAAAQLEGSKAFSKNLMKQYNIPTAKYSVFDDAQAAHEYVKQIGVPVVIKADGLCAGKGTIIAHTLSEAGGAIDLMMADRIFGDAGARILVEELLVGEEASIIAVTDGKTTIPMLTSQDHKRLQDGDQGPNTGGMGAYAPAPVVTDELLKTFMDEIVTPSINALASEGIAFKGVLYTGLMLTQEGPKVLEYNVRFGDPEIQAIVPLLKSDLLALLDDTVEGRLDSCKVEWHNKSCACVVLASKGYPADPEKGVEITGLEQYPADSPVQVFHAGTRKEESRFLTSGGRVLGVTGVGDDLESALKFAYGAIDKIKFDGMQYRKDIGARALKNPLST